MLRLSELLGMQVLVEGRRVGALYDLEVDAEGGHPAVNALEARRWGRPSARIAWNRDTGVGPDAILCPAAPGELEHGRGFGLRRHVLDAQVIDLAGKRIVRVGDVILAESDPGPRLIGVEIGAAPVLRRLGLSRFAGSHRPVSLDWGELHLPGPAGHQLQLDVAQAEIHRLSPEELAEIVRGLPHPRASRVLEAAGPRHAAAARRALAHRPHRPRFGRVLRARHRAPS
jgi:sporulation protein YlmC with PRC-barrel domain